MENLRRLERRVYGETIELQQIYRATVRHAPNAVPVIKKMLIVKLKACIKDCFPTVTVSGIKVVQATVSFYIDVSKVKFDMVYPDLGTPIDAMAHEVDVAKAEGKLVNLSPAKLAYRHSDAFLKYTEEPHRYTMDVLLSRVAAELIKAGMGTVNRNLEEEPQKQDTGENDTSIEVEASSDDSTDLLIKPSLPENEIIVMGRFMEAAKWLLAAVDENGLILMSDTVRVNAGFFSLTGVCDPTHILFAANGKWLTLKEVTSSAVGFRVTYVSALGESSFDVPKPSLLTAEPSTFLHVNTTACTEPSRWLFKEDSRILSVKMSDGFIYNVDSTDIKTIFGAAPYATKDELMEILTTFLVEAFPSVESVVFVDSTLYGKIRLTFNCGNVVNFYL